MKIGWLVWLNEESTHPQLYEHEPDYCYKSVQIVYVEVIG